MKLRAAAVGSALVAVALVYLSSRSTMRDILPSADSAATVSRGVDQPEALRSGAAVRGAVATNGIELIDVGPSGYLLAEVVNSHLQPIEGARVTVLVDGQVHARGVSAKDGTFAVSQVPSNPAIISATHGALQGSAVWEPKSSAESVEHVETPSNPSRVVLTTGGRLSGTVIQGVTRAALGDATVIAVESSTRHTLLGAETLDGRSREVLTDALGRFEFQDLMPGVGYRIHAMADGHVSHPDGLEATARHSHEAVDVAVEVLPVLGTFIVLADGSSGEPLSDVYHHLSSISVHRAPGEALLFAGLLPRLAGLRDDAALFRDQVGLFPVFVRVPQADTAPIAASASVSVKDFLPVEHPVTLKLVNGLVETTAIPLTSTSGALYSVTIRLVGPAGSPTPLLPPYGRMYVSRQDGVEVSPFWVPDKQGSSVLLMPAGTHRVRYVGAGGLVRVPKEPGEWREVVVHGPTEVELELQPPVTVVTFDLRHRDGRPRSGHADILIADLTSVDAATLSRRIRPVMFRDAPYVVTDLPAGQYEIYLDAVVPERGVLVQIPPPDSSSPKTIQVRLGP